MTIPPPARPDRLEDGAASLRRLRLLLDAINNGLTTESLDVLHGPISWEGLARSTFANVWDVIKRDMYEMIIALGAAETTLNTLAEGVAILIAESQAVTVADVATEGAAEALDGEIEQLYNELFGVATATFRGLLDTIPNSKYEFVWDTVGAAEAVNILPNLSDTPGVRPLHPGWQKDWLTPDVILSMTQADAGRGIATRIPLNALLSGKTTQYVDDAEKSLGEAIAKSIVVASKSTSKCVAVDKFGAYSEGGLSGWGLTGIGRRRFPQATPYVRGTIKDIVEDPNPVTGDQHFPRAQTGFLEQGDLDNPVPSAPVTPNYTPTTHPLRGADFYPSHAEKQVAEIGDPTFPKGIGVSLPQCPDCRWFMQARAIKFGVPQFVADPEVTRIFLTDGRVGLVVQEGEERVVYVYEGNYVARLWSDAVRNNMIKYARLIP